MDESIDLESPPTRVAEARVKTPSDSDMPGILEVVKLESGPTGPKEVSARLMPRNPAQTRPPSPGRMDGEDVEQV